MLRFAQQIVAVVVLALGGSASARDKPTREPTFHEAELKRAQAYLESVGMATDAPVSFDDSIKSRGQAFRRDRRIVLNPKHLPNRGALLSTLAHESRHIRDFDEQESLREKNQQLWREAEYATGAARAIEAGQASPVGMSAEAAVKELRDESDALIRKAREIWGRYHEKPFLEYRAWRVGAFVLGRQGRPPGSRHLRTQDNPDYLPRVRLVDAVVRGYTLGAKLALLRSPEFAALSREDRRAARARVNTYLAGYGEFLLRQSRNVIADEKEEALDFDPLAQRKQGRREQTSPRPIDAGTKEIVSAGALDAKAALSPLGRKSWLLAPAARPASQGLLGGVMARFGGGARAR